MVLYSHQVDVLRINNKVVCITESWLYKCLPVGKNVSVFSETLFMLALSIVIVQIWKIATLYNF